MMPAISSMIPPNISATPNTTGVTPALTALALTMLSMNVVTPSVISPSGAASPQSRVVARAVELRNHLARWRAIELGLLMARSSIDGRGRWCRDGCHDAILLWVRREPQRTLLVTSMAPANTDTRNASPSSKQEARFDMLVT